MSAPNLERVDVATRRFGLPRGAWKWVALVVALTIGVSVISVYHVHYVHRMERRLLTVLPDQVPQYPDLVSFAVAQAKPLFREHCAACHGKDMHGNTALGAPNLTDKVWLYGTGRVYDIERTLLYGIRSGESKARNVTDMPGFGVRGRLSDGQIGEVVQYLLKLNARPYDVGAANEGERIYYSAALGNCGDCHGSDARGDSDYGAPDLTVNVWNTGGDPNSLFHHIKFGEHHIMPGWLGPLTLEQIRAIAVYVYSMSHPPHPRPAPQPGANSYAAR